MQGVHVDAIAEHLQAISDGELQNLIINIPPRHSKSSLVSVLWPAWEWTQKPHLRGLFASYGLKLAIRDSLKRRRLIASAWYQEQWGGLYRLTGDQNEKMRYENDRTGFHIATSVGGIGTGEGGDRIVVDDPHNADEVDSDTIREGVLDWWDGTMSTRGNDPKTVARVIVMQRLHERDLVGHLLSKMRAGGQSYDHLILPAEYEPRVQVCLAAAPKSHDPRSEPGDLLAPRRFDRPALAALAADLGEAKAAGQLQQRPSPAGGSIFKRDWWDVPAARYDADTLTGADVIERWIFQDTALKDKDSNDWSAWSVVDVVKHAASPSGYALRFREVVQMRLLMPGLIKESIAMAVRWNADGKLRGIVVEDKVSGTSLIQMLRDNGPAWLDGRIIGYMPEGSKTWRYHRASVYCEAMQVLLPYPSPAAPWLADFAGPEGQIFKVPRSQFDDMADTFAMGILYLNGYLGSAAAPAESEAA